VRVFSDTTKDVVDINNSPRGGVVRFYDEDGEEIVFVGAGQSGNGGLMLERSDQAQTIIMGVNKNVPWMEFAVKGRSSPAMQLGPGDAGNLGLRIWNTANKEVINLEEMPLGDGGIWIGNVNGGTAATIAPNKDGVGIFHGITLPGIP
jgi:hypothetical protein